MSNIKIRSILEFIVDIDVELFLFLNGLHTSILDVIFYWVTGKLFWIPVYLVLLYLSYLKFKWKVFYIVGFFGLLLLIGDEVSVKLFKDVFERLRPCHNPQIAEVVHTLYGKCGGQFGFISSHSTNSFGLAIFSGFLLKGKYKYILLVMLLWAILVSYSRIYAGVHYPIDILGGAIIGCLNGLLVFKLMKFMNQKYGLKIENI